MKKQKQYGFIGVLLILLLLLSLAGCTEKEEPASTNFSIEGQATEENGDFLEMKLSVPVLSGFDAAGIINRQIAESIANARAEVEDAAAMLESEGFQMKAGLHTSYLYSKSGDLVSLWLMMDNYTGGAHGLYWIEPYTFHIATNEIYEFADLFQEGNASASMVTDKILEQINGAPDNYFPDAVETVKNYQNEFSFYINGNQLVVFFSLYDIAPYAAGIQFFHFDAEELKDSLKPEIYEAMKGASPIETKGTILESGKESFD